MKTSAPGPSQDQANSWKLSMIELVYDLSSFPTNHGWEAKQYGLPCSTESMTNRFFAPAESGQLNHRIVQDKECWYTLVFCH